ncbi:hypothetical protein OAS39_04435 [Pirellulales bacterium]|nr:hypothetical protein [Pirellulales bacterium]
MSRAIAIHFHEAGARAVLVEQRGDRVSLAAEAEVSWHNADDDRARGRRLADAISSWKPARTPVVAAVARNGLTWQNFELPPAPEEDLADLVHLQADRDQAVDEAGALDFLALEGNAHQSYRVWAVAASQAQVASVTSICSAASLAVAALAPLELGWPLLMQAVKSPGRAGSSTLAAAITTGQATVWSSHDDRVQLLRTAPLPTGADAAAMKALSGELRRTSLTLASRGGEPPSRWLLLCESTHRDALVELAREHSQDADVVEFSQFGRTDDAEPSITALNAPLIGLASNLAEGKSPAIDLLHPRQRPKPQSRTRIYSLAATAVIAAVGAVVWQGYNNLNAPLVAAAEATAEVEELTPMIEALESDVEQRQRVADWLAKSPNLMDAVATLSLRLRPEELDSESFSVEQDATVTRLTQSETSFTVVTAIPNADVAGAIENRLRDDRLIVSRQRLEKAEDAPAGYGHRLIVQIEKAPDSAADNADEEEAP